MINFIGAHISPRASITESRIEAAWRDLDSYVTSLQKTYSPEQQQELTAALWWQSHTKDEYGNKKALAAFRIFPEQALKPIEQLQFTELTLVGLQYCQNKALLDRVKSGQALVCEVVEQEIPTKNGVSLKRGVAVEGTFLAPLQQESPAYPVGTMFQAQFTVDPPAKVYAKLNGGIELTITGVRAAAYASHSFAGECKSLSITSVMDSGSRTKRLMVSLDGVPLGFLDRSSNKKFQSLSAQERASLTANLLSPVSTTARLQVDPNSLVHPWELQKRSLDSRSLNIDDHREQIRAQLRTQYDYYAKAARTGDPSLIPGKPLDREVARLATVDGQSPWQVAAIVSTSPTLTRDRPDTSSPDWSQYEEKAKEYVKRICDGVGERGGELSR